MEVQSESIRIQTPDGSMSAHRSKPRQGGSYPGVVVVMEAFGLNDHIRDVAQRLAAEGFVTLAPDLYYRDPVRVAAYEDLDQAIRLMSGLSDAGIVADMNAAIGALLETPEVRGERVGLTGFCMGGRVAFLTACSNEAVGGAVPFYGGGIGSGTPSERQPNRPIDLADRLHCPVLAFYGTDDPFIPMTEVEHVRDRLNQVGPEHEVVVYDSAPHGFFCNERDSYRPEAAEDAWIRMLRFFRRHLA